MTASYPDPVLSANIYCSDRLSEVIHHVIAPFWAAFRDAETNEESYLWVMRYSRCGEHLKVRLHGPSLQRASMRKLLGAAVESYFSELGPCSPDARQKGRSTAKPIDFEDQASSRYTDRSYIWTQYERSHISLGFSPFLENDDYVALLTRCLARGTEILLEKLEIDSTGKCLHSLRQTILLQALITCLASADFSAQDRALYLLYHRDWLLRGMIKQSGHQGGPTKMMELLDRFQSNIDSLSDKVSILSSTASSLWAKGNGNSVRRDAVFEAWSDTLGEFIRYVAPLCDDVRYHIDPFADKPVFTPIFRVLHGFANQLGLNQLNEAFAHQLLLYATSEDLRTRPVRMMPLL